MRLLLTFAGGRLLVPDLGREVTIGRDPENVLAIEGTDVSRHHCVIRATKNGHEVQDLGSRNGTLVNGTRIEIVRAIGLGDEVSVGKARIVLVPDGSDPPVGERSPGVPVLDAPPADALDSTRVILKDKLVRLNVASQAVASDVDLERLLGTILDAVLEFSGCERALLLLPGSNDHDLRPVLGRRLDPRNLAADVLGASRRLVDAALSKGEAAFVQGNGLALLLQAPRRGPGAPGAEDERRRGSRPPRSGRTLGALYLDGSRPRALETQDMTLLRSIGAQAALILENAQLHRQATQDPLTHVGNRGHFEQSLKEELELAAGEQAALALLLLDVDHFKRVNDVHGHQAGDQVLRELARRVREKLRRDDVVARYGGEEFAVLLPGTDQAGALTVAQKLLEAVRASPIGQIPVTTSIGVALFPAHGREPAVLVKRADQALYAAKHGGRNRVELWSAPLDQPGQRTDVLAGLVSGDPARDQRNLKVLLSMMSHTRTATTATQYLERVLDDVLELTRGARAMVIRGESASTLEVGAHRTRGNVPSVDGARYTQSVVKRCLAERRSFCAINSDALKFTSKSIEDMKLTTIMCVPLASGQRVVGVLYVDDTVEVREFTETDLVLLEAIAYQLSAVLVADERFRG